jgi:hypothetical protein
LLEESVRFPVIAVPLIEKAPVIVGTIGDDEWAAASVQYDPPAEFVGSAGNFQIAEGTPGWLRFVKVFQATEQTKQVKVAVTLHGVGTAWVDDIEIRPMRK